MGIYFHDLEALTLHYTSLVAKFIVLRQLFKSSAWKEQKKK